MTFTPAIDPDIEYPDSDGKPMADNTEQYEWIVKIKENLEILFANSPNVFIAGDLLWYPVQDKKSFKKTCIIKKLVVYLYSLNNQRAQTWGATLSLCFVFDFIKSPQVLFSNSSLSFYQNSSTQVF